MSNRLFITDKEVCTILEISRFTLQRVLGGFRRAKPRKGEKWVYLQGADPVKIGGYRRWDIVKLANVLGKTVEELEKRIA